MTTHSNLYEIAQALDPLLLGWSLDWDSENRPRCALFAGPDGSGMYVKLDRYKTPARLVITGRYCPPFFPRSEDCVRITVSSARPIADIAADIQRRFFPRYLGVYSQVRERQRLAEESKRQEATILAELATILDMRVSDDEVIRIRYPGVDDGYAYGRIRVFADRVKIDVSGIPIATAREICRLLREIE